MPIMLKKPLTIFACLFALSASAEAQLALIAGTFFKGPIIGGTDRFAGSHVLQVRGEKGLGTVTGGILTGPAVYLFNEEIVNFQGQVGTFHATVTITKNDRSVIVLGRSGFTSGASATAQMVTVQGSWVVLSASGPASGLQGGGQFTGDENFITGETQGVFSGRVN
jgi:energy-converting hydrogenase Eha subunit B